MSAVIVSRTSVSVFQIVVAVVLFGLLHPVLHGQESERLLMIGASPIPAVVQETEQTTYTESMKSFVARGTIEDMTTEDELLTQTLAKCKKSTLPQTERIVLFINSKSFAATNLSEDIAVLENAVAQLTKIAKKPIIITPNTDQATALQLAVFYAVADNQTSYFCEPEPGFPTQYYQKLFRSISQMNIGVLPKTAPAQDSTAVPAPSIPHKEALVKATSDVATSATTTTATSAQLRMPAPPPIRAFDPETEVGVTRRTSKKFPSVAK